MKIADDWYLILEMVIFKPCRAAFTLTPYWMKRVDSSNIYHGRDQLEVISELGLHDEPLMIQQFQEQLSSSEKSIMKKRLASHHLNFGRLNWRRDGFSIASLRSIATGFKLAPVGSVFYMAQVSFQFLRNRYRIARGINDQSQEI